MRHWTTIIEAADDPTDDELRAQIIAMAKKLPFRWRKPDGTTCLINPHLDRFIEKKDRLWLLDAVDHYAADLNFIKANPKCVLQRHMIPPTPPRQKKTLQAMLANIGGLYKKWFLEEYPGEPFDQTDLGAFRDWLKDQHSIEVRPDGLIEFWTLDRVTARAIGSLPVVLFHYTSSSLTKKIKANGLLSGMESVNDRSEDGVYLTTETSGPAIRGYALRARSVHGETPYVSSSRSI